MMSDFRNVVPALLITAIAFSAGCSDSEEAVTTDMHEDFDHEHKHQHTNDDDHEHEHADGFKGSHSHGHAHSHRHGEALHGGRIVSIGHTHHKDGATHFHAEVMPLANETIRFHLLTESDDGESQDFPIEDREIPALVSIKGLDGMSAVEAVFQAVGDGDNASEFTLAIPERLADGEAYSVVIPKVQLGGQRQNFTFTASRRTPDNGDVEQKDAAVESSDE